MSKKKLVFDKKSGAEKRLDRFEEGLGSKINYVQTTVQSYDGGRLTMSQIDEAGLWSNEVLKKSNQSLINSREAVD